jgi:hypothetical protein
MFKMPGQRGDIGEHIRLKSKLSADRNVLGNVVGIEALARFALNG